MTTDQATSLGHYPTGQRWEFDESVTNVFDDMIARSIPQHETMRGLVFDLGSKFVHPQTDIVDLGCSRGEALIPFMTRFGAHNRYVGIEVSEPMLTAAKERFAQWPPSIVRLLPTDLRQSYPAVDASLTLAVLTLMFIPINHRNRIIADVAASTRPGGAFVVVEKLIGSSATFDQLFVDRYHRMKAENGYSREEIDRKALALEGVQVPVTERENIRLLRENGFRYVETCWRWCNFAMFLAIK